MLLTPERVSGRSRSIAAWSRSLVVRITRKLLHWLRIVPIDVSRALGDDQSVHAVLAALLGDRLEGPECTARTLRVLGAGRQVEVCLVTHQTHRHALRGVSPDLHAVDQARQNADDDRDERARHL